MCTVEVQARPAADGELAKGAAAGEVGAFEALYRRHFRRVYALCLRMTANPQDAEDLTQEVFVQLLNKVGSFRGESQFTTWLHRLTVNHVLMHFRKKGIRLEQATDDDEPAAIVAEAGGPRRIPVIDRIALEQAVAQLPPGYRTVFVLHDVEGYNHGEIARMLGVSEGSSKSQLHRARLKLRNLMLPQAT